MVITFKMDNGEDVIEFRAIAKQKNNILTFADKNNKQNTITVEIESDSEVNIYQSGTIDMQQSHKLKQKTEGYYHGQHGVSMQTACFTKEIIVNQEGIFINYDYFSNDNLVSSNKLTIIYQ